MINIDTRLLKEVNADQLWLLCHIIKRADNTLSAFPSNKTLCGDTGWDIKKLQRVKASLIDSGLLTAQTRRNEVERQGSNLYSICTDLMGIFVGGRGIVVRFEDTPKTDTLSQTGVGGGTPKTDNEVLSSSEVLVSSDEDPKQSVLKFSTDSNSTEPQSKKTRARAFKSDRPEFPEYKEFVDIFAKAYPYMLTFPLDGVKIKSLIKKIRDQLANRGKDPTPEHVVEFWRIFVGNLPKTWGHGKDLSTIDSKFNSLVFELEHGRKQTDNERFNARTSAERYINDL